MFYRFVVRALLLLVLLTAVLPTHASTKAQYQFDPIILNMDGDLWSWQGPDQPLVQLTDWNMNYQPIMSPDGTRVAYISNAQVYADWAATQLEGGGGYYPPANIWILDIPSGQTYRIADQPADAVYTGPNEQNLGKYMVRTAPSWSPDGLKLAWLELLIDTTSGQEAGMAQLVIYDLASKQNTVLESFPITEANDYIDLYDVQWGRPGIAFKLRIPDGPSPRELHLYDASGNRIAQFGYGDPVVNTFFYSIWIQDQNQDYLFDDDPGVESWLNWQTQQIEPIAGIPEMVSLTAPDGARFFGETETWHVEFPGEEAVNLGERVSPYGISRDGQWVVYGRSVQNEQTGFFENAVIVQSKDESFEIGRFDNTTVLWGPTGWQIRP